VLTFWDVFQNQRQQHLALAFDRANAAATLLQGVRTAEIAGIAHLEGLLDETLACVEGTLEV